MKNREKETPPVILPPCQNLFPFPCVFLQVLLMCLFYYDVVKGFIHHDCKVLHSTYKHFSYCYVLFIVIFTD